jgi:hypothetical protein
VPTLPLRPLGGYRRINLSRIAVAAGLSLWFVFALGTLAKDQRSLFAALLVVPAAILCVRFVSGDRERPTLQYTVRLALILAGALVAAAVVVHKPAMALLVPGMALLTVIANARPAGTTIVLFGMTCMFGTIQSYIPIPLQQLADGVLAALWIGVLWSWFVSGRHGQVNWLQPGLVLVLLFVVISLLEVVAAPHVSPALRSFRVSTWYLMTILLLVFAPWWTAERHLRVLRGILAIAFFVGLYSTFRWITGQSGTEVAYVTSLSQNEFLNGKLRLFGTFTAGKELAAWAAATIPFLLGAGYALRDRWRWVAFGALGLCAIALFGADVRSGLLAVVPATGVVLIMLQGARAFAGRPRLGSALAATVAVALVGIGAFAFTIGGESATSARYKVILSSNPNDFSFATRKVVWANVLRGVHKHPLGTGIGTSGQVQARFGRFWTLGSYSIDNSYLKIAQEQGLPLMALYGAALLLLALGIAVRALSAADEVAAGVGVGAVGTLIALGIYMYANLSIEGLQALNGWILVGFALVALTRVFPRAGPQATTAAAGGRSPELGSA